MAQRSSKRTGLGLKWGGLVAVLLAPAAQAQAQSPYGLAARQTIPWVIDQQDERAPLWETEVNIHNPGPKPIMVSVTYLGAIGTPTAGRFPCQPQTVGPGETVEFFLRPACPLLFGLNFGRLELTTLAPGGFEEPSEQIFLASARVMQRGGTLFTVEGFPEGQLSGNKPGAAATGLKNGLVNNSQWQSFCAAAALNSPTLVVVRLRDGNNNLIGNGAGALLNPPAGQEMAAFSDVFAAVGAPPGSYSNVTARFSPFVPNGGGVFGVCMIVNKTTNRTAFEVAKYIDNNDDGRQYLTQVDETAWGKPFRVVSRMPHNAEPAAYSNLHVGYFQHPDRIQCSIRWTTPHPTQDQLQMRLVDPDGNTVAGGNGAVFFRFDTGEKPAHFRSRNGRWLVEVAPRRVYPDDCGELCSGGLEVTPYQLTCSSGNGHNQLDVSGHCKMTTCPQIPNSKEFMCTFAPFDGSRCTPF